jgi:hypothetical protein
MRAFSVLSMSAAAALTTACAGSGNSPDTLPSAVPTSTVSTERIVSSSGGAGVAVTTANLDNNIRLLSTGTAAQVWSVLPSVYEELGIPLTVKEDARKMIGNEGWRTRRSIGRVPMQRYLDCGRSGTIENAETYAINLTIVTTVQPNPSGGSVVGTIVTAIGRNPVTSSTQDVRCASTGDLEMRIRDMVQTKVAAMTAP